MYVLIEDMINIFYHIIECIGVIYDICKWTFN